MLTISNDVDLLKSLTKTLIDSVDGYRNAAANDRAGTLKEMFLERAVERQFAVERLQRAIREMGGEVDDSPSFGAQVHQRWLDLKSSIEGGDEDAILSGVAFGESYLQQKFQESVDEQSVQGRARLALEEAYASVCAGFHEIQAIKMAREGAGAETA